MAFAAPLVGAKSRLLIGIHMDKVSMDILRVHTYDTAYLGGTE